MRVIIWNDSAEIPTAHQQIMDSTIRQYKLKGQVHVLDDYWLQALIDQKFDNPRELDLNSILSNNMNIDSLYPYLATLVPTPQKAIIRNISQYGDSLLDVQEVKNDLMEKFPDMPCVRKF